MQKSKLLIQPDYSTDKIQDISPSSAGWDKLNFCVYKKTKDEVLSGNTANNEYAFIVLSGKVKVLVGNEISEIIGNRQNVFEGMPWAVYLSLNTEYEIIVESEHAEIAVGWCKAKKKYGNKIIIPKDVSVEIRGGENATRQINAIIPPGFDCDKLVVVEVYTPSGNWSSYPPHKHDKHIVDSSKNIIEADLEETYFYKIDKPNGYAIQQVYNDDKTLDEIIRAEDNDLVLVPKGYHPVVAAPGYNVYYLNFLVGSAQSLKASDDPKFAWVKDTWKNKDRRLPLVR